ncbi:ABC transporter permease subunit [Streptomyces zhihengii]|uniref:ABC transporter permease subunit n=1 Tax=Streptomyces zhihengii TaxID=1818004 RepID=A0ABS2UKX5_9ACTN|nr:ABC transporter permease subunit [Streptomyces zhihengii]MBM9618191.1 ABC transporter permease subunit [Streptomyces zhihengii]
MSAPATGRAPAARPRPDTPPTAEPRARFRHLLAAEWIALWSLRSTHWVLWAGAALVSGINVNSALSNARWLADMPEPPPGLEQGARPEFLFDPLTSAFTTPAWQILMVIAGSLGAMAVFGEYTTGQIRTTFAAVPDRRAVVAAKASVLAAVTLALGTVVTAVSFGVTQWILRDHDGLSVTSPGALRAVAASALLAPLCALVGLALGAVIRHAAGSVAAVVGVLVLLPTLFLGETYRWVKEIGNAMPFNAWNALVENPARDHAPQKYPVSLTEAWTVFGVWALVAVAVAVVMTDRRDV